MKIMQKIITLMFVGVLAPVSTQANSFTRVLAQNVTKQAAKQMLKNPAVIAAGLGAASWCFAKCQERYVQTLISDADKLSSKYDSMSAEMVLANKQRAKYEKYARNGNLIAKAMLCFAGNYFAFSQLKKHGYLPSSLTRNRKGLVALIAGLALAEERFARIRYFLEDYEQDPESSERTSKIATAALKAYPWVGAEMILGPLTYLAFFA